MQLKEGIITDHNGLFVSIGTDSIMGGLPGILSIIGVLKEFRIKESFQAVPFLRPFFIQPFFIRVTHEYQCEILSAIGDIKF